MNILWDLGAFAFGAFIFINCTYTVIHGVRNPPYSSRLFQGVLLALLGLFFMAIAEFSMFRENMNSKISLVIFTISLIVTIVSAYVFIKRIKNPPYSSMLFQYILFIMVGLYTMVLSVLKMLAITWWLK